MLRNVDWYLPTFRENLSIPYSRVKQSKNNVVVVTSASSGFLVVNAGFTLKNNKIMSTFNVGPLVCCCNRNVIALHFSRPAYSNRCLCRFAPASNGCLTWQISDRLLSYKSLNGRDWKWGCNSAKTCHVSNVLNAGCRNKLWKNKRWKLAPLKKTDGSQLSHMLYM
jgi:hypothetical protein